MTIDYSEWGKLKRRIEDEARGKLRNNSGGLVAVTIEIYLDARGNVVGWKEPQSSRFEPSSVNWCEALNGG